MLPPDVTGAPVAEPVDARDSKSRSERSARSSRARGTINKFFKANPYDELVFPGRATTEGAPPVRLSLGAT